jgi:hypothetical protein
VSRFALTDSGHLLFPLDRRVTLKMSLQSQFPRQEQYFPPGLLYISPLSAKPPVFPFESTFSYDGNSHFFAPRITLSESLLNSIILLEKDRFPAPNAASLFFDAESYVGDLVVHLTRPSENCYEISYRMPYLYRHIESNTSGISRTIVHSVVSHGGNTIFEPLPPFCRVNRYSLSGNCSNLTIQSLVNGSLITLTIKNGSCDFSYRFRCRFPHWSEFPADPERGFVLGPVIGRNGNGFEYYGNAPNLLLPTPDFSMVYNAPILTGLVFSLTFAILLRLVLEGKTGSSI